MKDEEDSGTGRSWGSMETAVVFVDAVVCEAGRAD